MAAYRLGKYFPLLMTAAGTIRPAKVVVMGAGVAGLQAVATAKRLGARVTAFDTRPVVAEQVRSLGGTFLEIDLGETGETAGWEVGDWNGDTKFSSGDMVAAFADGGYEQGPRTDAVAVPEPMSAILLLGSLIVIAANRRRFDP